MNPLPRLGSRPVRLVQALVPGLRIPGIEPSFGHGRGARTLRWFRPAIANVSAVAIWNINRRR